MPPIAAAKYSMGSELATELMTQATPTRMPLTITTGVGPKRSTRYPSSRTSHVSASTKIVNATWIAARPQWNFASSGPTNSVQPYCRFAIITMQTTPMASCTQRFARTDLWGAVAAESMMVLLAAGTPLSGNRARRGGRHVARRAARLGVLLVLRHVVVGAADALAAQRRLVAGVARCRALLQRLPLTSTR